MVPLWSIFALTFVVLVPATPVSIKRQVTTLTTLSLYPDQGIRSIHTLCGRSILPSIHHNKLDLWRLRSPIVPPSMNAPKSILAEMMLPQPTAKRTLTFKQWLLEVTAIVFSFVRKRLTADTISNNAHNPSSGYVGPRVLPIVKNSYRRASRNRPHQIVATFLCQTFLAISLISTNPSDSPSLPMLIFSSFHSTRRSFREYREA